MNLTMPIRRQESTTVELTILMPCLNEAETLATCIKKAKAYLDGAGLDGEVIIADNGSTDGSQEIATALGARVIPVATRGYGAALRGGIEAARGTYIIMGDADDSYDFSALDPFVRHLRDGADLVMGNRFKGGIADGAMPFLHRYLGNPVLSFLGRLFFGIKAKDFHCGLRGFNARKIRDLSLETTGMEFASEMVVRSALESLRIDEVPTTLKPDGRTRDPHLQTWRDGWRHLKFLLMYNPRWLFVIPGITVAALGILLAAMLFFGPFALSENVTLDFNSFVGACFMVGTGIQLFTFGVLSRYYAAITGLLPPNKRSDWLLENVHTDRLIINAAIFFTAGMIFLLYALYEWAGVGFGDIANHMVPRIVVMGLTLVAIGFQLFFSGFLLGVLRIPVERNRQIENAVSGNDGPTS